METVNVNTSKDIRLFPEVCVSIPCLVENTGVIAGADGKKIIKAGTPVGSETDVFENRETVLADSSEHAIGVVLHDVDVTNATKSAPANASVLIGGYVDLLKVDSTVTAKINNAKEKLAKITFMKGAK